METTVKKVNYGKDIVEPFICKMYNLKSVFHQQEIGIDAIDTNGITYEIKFFGKNRPSFTNLKVDFDSTLLDNIKERAKADKYILAFATDSTSTIENADFVVMDKKEFCSWVYPRIILDKSSKGHWQFRINKNPRSKNQDSKMVENGLRFKR